MPGTQTKRAKKKPAKQAGSKSKAKAKVEKGVVVPASKSKAKKKKKKRPARRPPRYTSASDKYELYQLAVQSPEADVDFLRDTFKRIRRRKARHLREDFCGTALLSTEWVRDNKKNTAEGFDNDPECLEWGSEHNLGPLGKDASRVTLHLGDVRERGDVRPDIRVAFNFSFNILQAREELLAYFRLARKELAEGGIFAIDVHGGTEASDEVEEAKDIDEGFTYIWDQAEYQPVTGRQQCYIHFEFKDGSRLDRAFSYVWRLWSMPELVDLLREAGFARVECYFEGDDPDSDEGNGIFERSDTGENCPSWIAYILAYD